MLKMMCRTFKMMVKVVKMRVVYAKMQDGRCKVMILEVKCIVKRCNMKAI